jgi:hypothetical protein
MSTSSGSRALVRPAVAAMGISILIDDLGVAAFASARMVA